MKKEDNPTNSYVSMWATDLANYTISKNKLLMFYKFHIDLSFSFKACFTSLRKAEKFNL